MVDFTKTLISIGFFLFAIICVGTVYQRIATKLDEKRFPPEGKLIDIGGYRLHLHGMGQGTYSVVLESGCSLNSLEWTLVQPEIAKFARVYSYDRAGLGCSDMSPHPRTSRQMVEELHTLLEQEQAPKPYILVGHSLGGVNVRLFAHRYPDEVCGMVLVDSSHEDQESRIPEFETLFPLKYPRGVQFLVSVGMERLLMHFPQSKKMLRIDRFSDRIQKTIMARYLTTKYVKTLIEENRLFETSLSQLKETNFFFGNKPLIVVTAARYVKGDEQPDERVKQLGRVWNELQKELVYQSSRGTQVIAHQSNHLIMRHQPEIIVEAVREVARISNGCRE